MYIANAHSFISLPASMYHTGFYSSSLMPPMRSSTVIRSISAVMLPSSSSDISESINFSGDAAFLDLLGSPWSALELLVEGWVEGRRGVTQEIRIKPITLPLAMLIDETFGSFERIDKHITIVHYHTRCLAIVKVVQRT